MRNQLSSFYVSLVLATFIPVALSAQIEFEAVIGGPYVTGNAIIQTNDRGYAIAGYSEYDSSIYHGVYFVKLNSTGNLLWAETIGGYRDERANSVIQTKDGGYAITGYTYSFGDTLEGDIYTIKLDSIGNLQWTKTIGGKGSDIGNSIIQTEDGGYAIAGSTNSYGDTINGDIYILKLDSSGDVEWTETNRWG